MFQKLISVSDVLQKSNRTKNYLINQQTIIFIHYVVVFVSIDNTILYPAKQHS